jgi:hypothetical protein
MWSAKVTGYRLPTKENLKLTLGRGHAGAFFCAGATGLYAFLAVIHIMPATLFGACITNISA